MSAGLTRDGPAASDYVGRVEAARDVRRVARGGPQAARARPRSRAAGRACASAARWSSRASAVASQSQVGIPFLTGSEEERGPLYDITGEELRGPARGRRGTPARREGVGARRGRGRAQRGAAAGLPAGAADDRVAARARARRRWARGSRRRCGRRSRARASSDVVLSGLANEFILYLTTPAGVRPPALRGRQHPVRAPCRRNLLKNEIARLAGRLARNQPAPDALRLRSHQRRRARRPGLRPRRGSATVLSQPARRYARLQRAELVVAGRAAGPGPAGRQARS